MDGTERRSSTASSRGYTLEPPAQRRRMSWQKLSPYPYKFLNCLTFWKLKLPN
jgi:hypothetical protein